MANRLHTTAGGFSETPSVWNKRYINTDAGNTTLGIAAGFVSDTIVIELDTELGTYTNEAKPFEFLFNCSTSNPASKAFAGIHRLLNGKIRVLSGPDDDTSEIQSIETYGAGDFLKMRWELSFPSDTGEVLGTQSFYINDVLQGTGSAWSGAFTNTAVRFAINSIASNNVSVTSTDYPEQFIERFYINYGPQYEREWIFNLGAGFGIANSANSDIQPLYLWGTNGLNTVGGQWPTDGSQWKPYFLGGEPKIREKDLDLYNPYAKDCIATLIPDGATAYNAVTQSVAELTNTDATMVVVDNGDGTISPNKASSGSNPASGAHRGLGYAVALGDMDGKDLVYYGKLYRGGSNGDAIGQLLYLIDRGNNMQLISSSYSDDMRVAISTGYTNHLPNFIDSQNKEYEFLMHYSGINSSFACYVNGVLFARGTATASLWLSINASLGIGSNQDKFYGSYLLQSDTAYSVADLENLAIDPWQIFKEQEIGELDYALQGGAGMNVTAPAISKPDSVLEVELVCEYTWHYGDSVAFSFAGLGTLTFHRDERLEWGHRQGGGWSTDILTPFPRSISENGVVTINLKHEYLAGTVTFTINNGTPVVVNTVSVSANFDRLPSQITMGTEWFKTHSLKIKIDGVLKRFYDFNRKSGTEVPELYYGLNGTLNNFPLDPHTDENGVALTTSGWLPVLPKFFHTLGAGKDYETVSAYNLGAGNGEGVHEVEVHGRFNEGMYFTKWTGKFSPKVIIRGSTPFDGDTTKLDGFSGVADSTYVFGCGYSNGKQIEIIFKDLSLRDGFDVVWNSGFNLSTANGSSINISLEGCHFVAPPFHETENRYYLARADIYKNCVIEGFVRLSRANFSPANKIIDSIVVQKSGLNFQAGDSQNALLTNVVLDTLGRSGGWDASSVIDANDLDAFEDLSIGDHRIKQAFADTYLTGTGYQGSDVASWSWVAGIDPALWAGFHTLTENAATPALGSALTTLITEANLPADIWDIAEPSEHYLTFDGVDDYLEINSRYLLNYETSWAAEIDCKFSTASSAKNFVDFDLIGTLNYSSASGLFSFTYRDAANLTYSLVIPEGLPVGERFKLSVGAVVTGSDMTTTVSVNDIPVATNTHSGGLFSGRRWFRLEPNSGAGTVDVFGLSFFFNGTKTSFYEFSGEGTVLNDILGNNNATLYNSPQWRTINGGGDLRVCRHEDGASLIPLEVVKWDTRTKKAVLWTRVPNFKTGEKVTLFYGKAGETQPLVTDTFGRNAVWAEADYANHFDNSLTLDSSGNYTGQTVVGSPVIASGIVGDSMDVGTRSDVNYILLRGNPLGNKSLFTASFFINAQENNFRTVFGDGPNTLNTLFRYRGTLYEFQVATNTGTYVLRTGTALENQWVKIDCVYDGSEMRIYANSSLVGSLAANGVVQNLPDMTIGTSLHSPAGGIFSGKIDEFSIREIASTQDYIAAEYANQSSPATFWSSDGVVVSTDIDLSGSFGVLPSFLGNLFKQSTLAAQSNTYGTFDGSLSKLATISGSLSATVSLDGYPSKVTSFADSFVVTSDTTGAFGKVAHFTDSFSVTSDTTGAFGKVANMVGTSYSTFTLDGVVFVLDPTVFLNGVTSIQSFTAGNMTKIGRMAGATSLIFDANGTLRKSGNLTGSLAVQSIVDSAIAKASSLSGASNTESSVLSSLEKTVILLGEINSNASLFGESQKQALLYGALSLLADTDGVFINDAGVVSVVAISIDGELLLNTVIGVGSQISYIDAQMDSIDIVIDAKIKPTIGSL